MEESREFKLVSSFDDGITRGLKKVNKSIKKTVSSFKKYAKQVKKIDECLKVGKFLKFNKALKEQNKRVKKLTSNLKKYVKVCKMLEGKKIKLVSNGEVSKAKNLVRELKRINREYKRYARRKASMPSSPPSSPNSGSGSGGGSSGGGGFSTFRMAGAVALGNIISGMATAFMRTAFDIAKGAIVAPIKFLAGALQERIEDEMSDIKSAGGIFSVGRKEGIEFANTYEKAVDVQKRLNQEMATMAAALPGTTNDYVQNMKQITDTTIKLLKPDQLESSMKIARRFAKQEGDVINDSTDAFVQLSKQITKFTTLGGLGGSGTPLYTIFETLMGEEEISIKKLKGRFRAAMRDPLISGALEDFEMEMNKAQAGTAERFESIIKAFEQAFPQEVINAMEMSADGLIQSTKSAFLDPDTGLFGLGRRIMIDFSDINSQLKAKGQKELNYIKEEMDVFSLIRETVGNFVVPMQSIFFFLPKIFEPLETLVSPLKELYVNSRATSANFQNYLKAFKEGGKGDISSALDAGILALNDLSSAWGADPLGVEEVKNFVHALNGGSQEIEEFHTGQAVKQVFRNLLNSDFLNRVGFAVGNFFGNYFTLLADLIVGTESAFNQSGLISGAMKGWKKSGGTKAVKTIFSSLVRGIIKVIKLFGDEIYNELGRAEGVKSYLKTGFRFFFDALGKGIVFMLTNFPLESAIFGAIFIPGIAEGLMFLAKKIVTSLWSYFGGSAILASVKTTIVGALTKISPMVMGIGGATLGIVALLAGIIVFQDQIRSGLRKARENMAGWDNVFGSIGVWVTDIALLITDSFSGLWDMITGKREEGMIKLERANTHFWNVVGEPLIWIGTVFREGFEFWKLQISNIIANIKMFLMDIKMGVKMVVRNFKNGFINIANDVKAKLAEEAIKVKGKVLEVVKAITSFFDGVLEAIGKFNPSNLIPKNTTGRVNGGRGNQGKKTPTRVQHMGTDNSVRAEKSVTDAYWKEKRNSPIGSTPVMANSSELIIPNAFKGNGSLRDLIGSITGLRGKIHGVSVSTVNLSKNVVNGNRVASTQRKSITSKLSTHAPILRNIVAGNKEVSAKVESTKPPMKDIANKTREVGNKVAGLNSSVNEIKASNKSGFTAIAKAIFDASKQTQQVIKSSMSFDIGGPLGGSIGGGMKAFQNVGQKFGLVKTSGYRPGDPGYHGIGRAIDLSNGTGPTPQMMMAAQFLARVFGRHLKELIYTPLGWSIKNGKKVPAYAKENHYNHVHVAWNKGNVEPLQKEMQSMPSGSALGFANSSETILNGNQTKMLASTLSDTERNPVTNTNNIQIIIPGYEKDPEQLAMMVVRKLEEAKIQAEQESTI